MLNRWPIYLINIVKLTHIDRSTFNEYMYIREDNYLLFYVQLRAVTPQNKAEQKVSINKLVGCAWMHSWLWIWIAIKMTNGTIVIWQEIFKAYSILFDEVVERLPASGRILARIKVNMCPLNNYSVRLSLYTGSPFSVLYHNRSIRQNTVLIVQ